ncbi:hypothetical protein BD414DRAFT_489699 [Trametes punicea]|nr:hypothetical protein BD414DRAFT_489699 [Trametes punicea]
MARRTLTILFALLPAASLALSSTYPVVAWSTRHSKVLSSPALSLATKTGSNAIASALYNHDDICEHDAVVVIDHAGLHASDLRALSPSHDLSKALSNAPSSLKVAYAETEYPNSNPFDHLVETLTQRCGSRALSHGSDLSDLEIDAGKGKHVVSISLPALEEGEEGASRKTSVSEHESWLSEELSKIEAAFPNYLAIYAGSPLSPFQRRQSSMISSTFEPAADPVDSNGSGGILKRYQLLTPGLILALLVALFVLLPIIFVGVSALASIQSPLGNEIPKGFNAEEKKNQ